MGIDISELRKLREQMDEYEKYREISTTSTYGSPTTYTYVGNALYEDRREKELKDLKKKVKVLEKKMEHMEETFAKTVQKLVEALSGDQ